MAKPQRRLVTPKEYEVGVDITQEQYNEAIQKIGDWFAEWRNTKEPVALARRTLDACLKGTKPSSGEPWFEMASSPLASRVRSACRFDLVKMEPIRTGSEKYKQKREAERVRKERKRLAEREDANIPDELRADLKNSAKYGDNPHVFLSSEESKVWQELYNAYLEQFPELRTVNGRTELMTLCDLQIHLERLRFKLLKNDKSDATDPIAMASVAKQIADFKRALGIHPEQLAKRAKEETALTIGAAAAKLESMEDWRKLRLRYFAEELIQSLQKAVTLKADGTGYQIEEFQLFAETRCRLVHCPDCGTPILGGFRMEEALNWLVKHGHLAPLPPETPLTLEGA